MAGHLLICGRTTFNLDTAFEVRTTPYQGYVSSTVEGGTLRRAAFRVNGSKRAVWRALANVRKRRKSPGYERQRRIFYRLASRCSFETNKWLRASITGFMPKDSPRNPSSDPTLRSYGLRGDKG